MIILITATSLESRYHWKSWPRPFVSPDSLGRSVECDALQELNKRSGLPALKCASGRPEAGRV